MASLDLTEVAAVTAAQFLPVNLENEWMFENSYITMTAYYWVRLAKFLLPTFGGKKSLNENFRLSSGVYYRQFTNFLSKNI